MLLNVIKLNICFITFKITIFNLIIIYKNVLKYNKTFIKLLKDMNL